MGAIRVQTTTASSTDWIHSRRTVKSAVTWRCIMNNTGCVVQHNSSLLDHRQNIVQVILMRTFLSAWEKTPRKKESCDPSFFRIQTCLGLCSCAPPGVQQTGVRFLQLLLLVYAFAVCGLWLWLLVRSLICPMLKVGFGMRLKPPHLSAPFSQVPAPLEWRTDHKCSFQNTASRNMPLCCVMDKLWEPLNTHGVKF